jgi:methylmalonyl-CoA mutase
MPVFGCIASQFNDPGVNQLYRRIMDLIAEKCGARSSNSGRPVKALPRKFTSFPRHAFGTLSEISENNRKYDEWVEKQVGIARRLFGYQTTLDSLNRGPKGCSTHSSSFNTHF